MILAVDDDQVSLLLIEAALQDLGVEVETFLDVDSALDRAAKDVPGLVISDIHMPKLDGFQFRKALERLHPEHAIPFIFLSSQASTSDFIRGLDAGADDYLTKPIDPKLLEAKVKALLRRGLKRRSPSDAGLDALTQLPGRPMVLQQLDGLLSRARRQGTPVGILLLDVDNFRRINDSLGHTSGDILLQETARRIQTCLRKEDVLGRLGGDEFIVLLPDLRDRRYAETVAQNIQDVLRKPFLLDGKDVVVGASAGIAYFPDHGEFAGLLVKHADGAMYRAKELGRNQYQVFDQAISEDADRLFALVAELQNAIARSEFQLMYQPKIDLEMNLITGFEALIRWKRADSSMVPPDLFIPLAEKHGLIESIDRWVLFAACRQLQVWHQSGFPNLTVSVNISAEHFRHGTRLRDLVDEVLEATGLAPGALLLEITETALVQDVDDAVNTSGSIRDLGVRFSMDDFGTGYSSLSLLKSLPLAELKLDKIFVDDLPHNHQGVSITWATLSMAQSLNLKVVAEGIENMDQADFLRSHHCEMGQGYLFSKPLPAKEISKLLEEGRALKSAAGPLDFVR